MSDNQEREEAQTGNTFDDSIATRQERLIRLHNRFPSLEEHLR